MENGWDLLHGLILLEKEEQLFQSSKNDVQKQRVDREVTKINLNIW